MFNYINIRNPDVGDGAGIWELIRDSKPLDLNSSYLYLLLCKHFPETCLIAEKDSGLLGFVSAYIPPKLQDVIFVWQIAVHKRARKRGLAKTLLHKLIRQDSCRDIEYMEVSVSPSNHASMNLFHSFARDVKADCKEKIFFTKEFFPGGENHEEEILLHLGPICR